MGEVVTCGLILAPLLPLQQWYISDSCRTEGQGCTTCLDLYSGGVQKWLALPFGDPFAEAVVWCSWHMQN